MRALRIGFTGLGASFLAFGLSQISDGFVGAIAFMASIFISTVTIGLVVSVLVDNNQDHRAERRSRRSPPKGSLSTMCGSCGQSKVMLDVVWVCDNCDRVSARPLPFDDREPGSFDLP